MNQRKIDEAVTTIVKEIGLDAAEVSLRKAYLKLEDRDLALLKGYHEKQAKTSVLVDAFYEHLLSFDETRGLLPDAAAVMRLKQTLALYFNRLTGGDYGVGYIQDRIQIGLTHQRIGLAPKWYFGAYAQCLAELLPRVLQAAGGNVDAFMDTYRALLKVVFLDMGLAIDAYRHADRQAISTVNEQTQSVLSSLPLGILLLSEQLQVLSANLAFRETQGDRDAEFRGKLLRDVLPVSGLEDWARLVMQQGGRQHQIMIDIHNSKGERRFQMVTMRGMRSAAEDKSRLLLVIEDVTERQRAEQAVRDSRDLMLDFLENANDLIQTVTPEGRFEFVNRAWLETFGYSHEDLSHRTLFDIVHPDDRESFKSLFERIKTGESLRGVQAVFVTKDGRPVAVEGNINSRIEEERAVIVRAIFRDITKRKQAEERLRKSEAQLAAAQEIAHSGSWDWDLSTHQITWSDELYRIYGLKPGEIGVTYEIFLRSVHPEDVERIKRLLEKAIEARHPFSFDYRLIRRNGSVRIVHTQGEVLCGPAGTPTQVIGTAQDVTERRQAEDELRQSEERFRQVTESISEVFWMTSVDKNQMIYISPTYWEIWGASPQKLYEDPRAWLDAIHPEDRERVIAAFPKQVTGEYDMEYRIIRPDQSMRWIRDRAFPIRDEADRVYRVVGIAEDITERKKAGEALQKAYKDLQDAQAHLLQSEKMASLGQMAAGVAHEINNPVGFVSSNLRTLEEYMSDLLQLVGGYEALLASVERGDPEAVEGEKRRVRALSQQVNVGFLMEDLSRLVEQSLEGMDRVRRIVQDLKEFSHIDRAERMRFNLNGGIESTLNIVWNELKYKAEVIKELGDIPEILCYPQQINQVFMNLLVNAAQSMPKKGKIWIRSRVEGDWIVVEIEDTGCGIAAEHLKKIFDPFFTTKPVGKGTGLGLSVSYGIVQKHKGKIEVESTVGKGTKFRVLLPMAGSI
ncbi:MAG: PAS domain S-box protein [Candidatus Manganitrophaceae bacterium]|nr:MAG: PAS domain S-box protein [Candidatus Manganitrophaceae bacterium]